MNDVPKRSSTGTVSKLAVPNREQRLKVLRALAGHQYHDLKCCFTTCTRC